MPRGERCGGAVRAGFNMNELPGRSSLATKRNACVVLTQAFGNVFSGTGIVFAGPVAQEYIGEEQSRGERI
jgi:hypothetical protein